jgi:cbb3-type cytochrome oxidase subunit 3
VSLLSSLAPLAGRLADPPLDPTPDEARSRLRRELLAPEYHEQNVLQRIVTWLSRRVDGGVQSASEAPPLQTFAVMVLVVLLVGGLALLLSRARRTARADDAEQPVLTGEDVTAAELRARAEAAMGEGRHEDALVDGFRALALRQVERGRLDDAPGTTAHEVALSLAAAYPHQRPRVDLSALLFDSVLYGDRPATAEQAADVLALDDELAGVR